MNRLTNFLSVFLSSISLLSVIWIVVPAPFYFLWLFSVAASEWSLYLGLLALLGVVCTLISHFVYHAQSYWFLTVIGGLAAVFISLYPLLSVFPVAREQNVSLSLLRYFAGLNNLSVSSNKQFTTEQFAQTGGQTLSLDVYQPTTINENNGAAVIVVHGGSWNAGARNDFPQWNAWLASEGYTIFDVDYRLAPQPNYLSSVADIKCAVKWIKSRAVELKISPERLALFGRSAGGHLALLAAYAHDDQNLPSACDELKESEKVRAVAAFYAPTDLIWAFDHPANRRVLDGAQKLSDFLGGSPHLSAELNQKYSLTSPVVRVSAGSPATLLVHGGQDQLVRAENMQLLADKLNKFNVPHQTIELPYAQHGFDYDFNGWGSQIVQPAMLEFLRDNTGE